MDPENPNVNDLLKMLNKKRGRYDVNSKDIINELKLMSLEKMEEVFLGKKLNNRELSRFLNDLEFTFIAVKLTIEEDTSLKNDINKSTFIALTDIHIQIIVAMKKALEKEGRKFDILKYIVNERKKIEKSMVENQKNKSSKRRKVDEYESDSDDGTSVEDNDDEEEDDEEDDEEEEDEEDEDYDSSQLLNNKVGKEFIEQIYRGRGSSNDMEDETLKYFSQLSEKDRMKALNDLKEINNYQNKDKPILFRIMNLNIPIEQKHHILKNYISASTSRHNEKLQQWVDAVMQIPFGEHKGINLSSLKENEVKGFIEKLQKSMDDAVWGHDEAKRQIIQMMGQQIRNPKAKGNMLGIWGVPGNGKSSLIKEGIAKAMDKPFIFISLGGATDASFLEGHSFTYEGSIYGRIANGLITSKCMDPIIYFDELDKISKTAKGEEITNILIHLTDPVQNSHFRDKYFHGLDIDLSRATMIFSFNDPSEVNHVLMDRITTVETKYLLTSQKIHIAKNYLLPEMFKDMGFQSNSVVFPDDVIRDIINKFTSEGGIRKLKSLLYNVVREINLANLINNKINNRSVNFPFNVKFEDVKVLLKNKREIEPEKVNTKPKSGIVNGLWANSLGNGGILKIEVVWFPTSQSMQVKATGSLEKVIKESTEVATSVAWNYLEDELKDKFLELWKTKPMGFHIHCPDGATPKDGPSAGGALTLALYSLLTHRKIKNDIAMTGEINLQGEITAIGGLEEKLEGAKKAGCVHVLVPKENQRDLDKIKERNVSLLDNNFKVTIIETFGDIIQHALLPPQVTDTPFMKGYYREDNIDKINI